MYNFIIIWGENLASFGLVFDGDWAGNFILTWQHCAWSFVVVRLLVKTPSVASELSVLGIRCWTIDSDSDSDSL